MHAEQEPAARGEALLAGQVGAEVATALTSALERVRLLSETGRIGLRSLQALQQELQQARQIAIIGQQVSRLAAGRVRQAPEPLDLPSLLREAVHQCVPELAARGLELRQRLQTAGVSADPSLLFTLLRSLLDWAFEHCRGGALTLRTGLNPWPVHAVLHCEFAWRAPDLVPPGAGPEAPGLDTIAWRMVEQSAQAMGVRLQRQDTADRAGLVLSFAPAPRRWPRLVDALAALESPDTTHGLPLAGREVMLLARRPDSLALLRESTTALGLALRVPSDPGQALAMARAAVPDAIVVDARDPELDRVIADLRAGRGGPALVHVGEDFDGLEIRTSGSFEILRLARDSAARELPSALNYALAPHPA